MELWCTIAVGLALSATATGLMVSHVRTWRRFEESGDAADPRERGYRRRQFRRRVQTSALLGLLALAMVAGHWMTSPPWRPWAFTVYWGIVLIVVAWVALLALADLVSTRLYFGHVRERYRWEETRLKAELERMKEEGRRRKDEA
jgi:sterol desaturase/sphingolipid hydroxylase (fatty acid hydroxylase superfamily)